MMMMMSSNVLLSALAVHCVHAGDVAKEVFDSENGRQTQDEDVYGSDLEIFRIRRAIGESPDLGHLVQFST